MADPVSITGIVLQVGSLVQSLYEYGKAVRYAQKDIVRLCSELSALKSVLSDLESRSDQHVEATKERLETTQSLMSDIIQELAPKTRKYERGLQSLKWPFSEAQVRITLDRIERLKSWFLLRMMTDTHSETRTIQANLNTLKLAIEEDASERRLQLAYQHTNAIRKLLAPVSPSVMHRKSCEISSETPSGSWLLEGKCKQWLSSNNPSERVLVLTGRSGSGKTTILSQAVEHARVLTASSPSIKIGYFYCSYSTSASLELRNMLGSWLVQITSDEPSVLNEYEPYLADFTEVKPAQIERSIAKIGGTVLLFLDAINESHETQRISDCLQRLASTSGSTIIKCFLTATPMFHLSCSNMQIDMLAESIAPDIETYVRRKITQHAILQSVPETEMVDKLVRRANGMFR